MATGFSVMDALNKNSRAGTDESPRARFRTKDISIHKMYRNEKNFYAVSGTEELAGDILIHGLKQNLELMYEPSHAGEYRIISGERRWEALKLLVSRGYREFEIATCRLTSPQDDDEEQIEVISANAYRIKSVADMMEEERRLKQSLERLRAAGRKIKGYDLTSGRLRDIIASMLQVSATKVAQIESVSRNLIPEFSGELKEERLTFSAAYELSGMKEQEQREAFAVYREHGGMTHKDVKGIKKKRREGMPGDMHECTSESVSESDTGKYVPCGDALVNYGTDRKDSSSCEDGNGTYAGDDHEEGCNYQTPHPEGITSLCYSCSKYMTCNVKTGTCRKCDQYVSRTEAGKTEEQRYSDEQDRIDREVRKKMREQEDGERMKNIPSVSEENRRKTHRIKIGKSFFEDARTGKKPFELRKNDRDYRVNDILEMEEYADGKSTGRVISELVTYVLEDYAGLEDGYCILGTRII